MRSGENRKVVVVDTNKGGTTNGRMGYWEGFLVSGG